MSSKSMKDEILEQKIVYGVVCPIKQLDEHLYMVSLIYDENRKYFKTFRDQNKVVILQYENHEPTARVEYKVCRGKVCRKMIYGELFGQAMIIDNEAKRFLGMR